MLKKSLNKILIFLLGVVLLVILSHAVKATDSYDSWSFSGDSFTYEGDVYTVTHYDFYDTQVILGVNKNAYIIGEGSCKSTGTKEYCITEIYRNLENSTETDHIKFESGVPYAGIHVTIKDIGPDVSVSTDFSNTTPELNQEVTVIVTVKNEEVLSADSFTYQDDLPSAGIVITGVSGAERNGQRINYKSYLPANSKKTFSYSFKIVDYVNFINNPRASYTYEGKTTNISVASTSINVVKPYVFTAILSTTSIEAGDQSVLSINILNKVSSDINVSELKIIMPAFISVQSKPGELVKQNDAYTWKGTLETGKYELINMILAPVKSGTYLIPINLTVKDSAGKNFSETKNLSLNSNVAALSPILSVLDSSISEGSRYRVAFSVNNPNFKVGFKNINASLKSELFPEMKVNLAELGTNTTQTLLVNDTLTAPFIEQKKVFVINASGSYETTTGEHFSFSKVADLTVTLVNQAITIVQSADQNLVRAGDNITLTIQINNNNQEAVNVYAYDKYGEEANFIGGKASETLSFDQAGSKQAYTYKLHIPDDYPSNSLLITTIASIEEKGYSVNKTLNISINNSKIIAEKKPEPEKKNETAATPPKAVEKKPGFFQRVIDSVTNFFKRLLGSK